MDFKRIRAALVDAMRSLYSAIRKPTEHNESACSAPPPPSVEPLLINSKYKQSDKTKSELSSENDDDSARIKEPIDAFSRGVANFAENDKTECLGEWLDSWSSAGALTTTAATGTGKAVRKWALANISLSVFKAVQLGERGWRPSLPSINWLESVGRVVVADYDDRLKTDFKYFNNHDHWAAWAAFSTGMLSENKGLIAWAVLVFDKAMSLAIVDEESKHAHFALEVARGRLGLNYTCFSLAPLVMLAHYMPKNGHSVSRVNENKLNYLVNIASDLIIRPDFVVHIVSERQTQISGRKLAWLIPFMKDNPENLHAIALFQHYDGDVDGSVNFGGNIARLFD